MREKILVGLLVVGMLLSMYLWTKPLPVPQPTPLPEPITTFNTEHMIVWQQGIGRDAVGFSVATDDISWTCFVDRPLGIAKCSRTINPPEIP